MVKFADNSLPDLDEGEYSAVLIGVVYLGAHEKEYKGKKTVTSRGKFIFEIPTKTNDKGETRVIAKTVKNLTTNSRGAFLGLSSILLGKKLTSEDLAKYNRNVQRPLEETLGKQVSLTIEHFTTDDGTKAYVKEIRAPHPKDDPVTATKEFVYFDPYVGTVDEFNKLTYYTKNEVMSALDASDFPAAIHKQWVKDQEAEKVRQAEKDKQVNSALE